MTGEISSYRCFGDEMHKVELTQVFCFTKAPQAAAAKATEGPALPVWTALRKTGYQFKPNNIIADLGWQFWPSPQFFCPLGSKRTEKNRNQLKKKK